MTDIEQMPWLDRAVDVRGARVRYGATGGDNRTLVLVHGHRCHSRWWQLVAPRLAPNWQLVLLDLSGHGDSSHRDGYDGGLWADEVATVVEAAGIQRLVLVGHSMGGRVALASALAHPQLYGGVITLDSVIRLNGPGTPIAWDPTRQAKIYPDLEDVVRRFKLRPEQPGVDADVLRSLAVYGAREVPGGWTLKYDVRGVPTVARSFLERRLPRLSVPWTYAYATESRFPTTVWADELTTSSPVPVDVVPIVGAHHHAVLDQPERCADLIDGFARKV